MDSCEKARLVPQVKRLEAEGGEFVMDGSTVIVAQGGDAAARVAELAAEYLRPPTDFRLEICRENVTPAICFRISGSTGPDRNGFWDEGYKLDVDEDGVRIESASECGLLAGLQTLRQLFPPQIYASDPCEGIRWALPCVHVEDEPAFRWRGLHLDVSRHFFPPADVCRFIELMALHRFNVFHWHLTDDQGWRIEISKYPELTRTGSQRPCTLTGHERERPRRYDDVPYGGFYSRQEIKDIVEFAARRGITVVPEIDMPGHMQAAIAAYPELGNTDMTLQPRCHWGISHHILNPEESTVRFMQDVLGEVAELFPGLFIHIGGDEAVKTQWSESRRVQDAMRRLGLGGEEELQSWFIGRMNTYLREKGRRLIGWDEIMSGGLPEGAAVMIWRQDHAEERAKDAVAAGHDVVMAPGGLTYFDHYQAEPVENEPLAIGGLTTVEDVYRFNPVPEGIDQVAARHILGGQGQLWTEYISTPAHLEYMAYPRASALSEVLWRGTDRDAYCGFAPRLREHLDRLRAFGCRAAEF